MKRCRADGLLTLSPSLSLSHTHTLFCLFLLLPQIQIDPVFIRFRYIKAASGVAVRKADISIEHSSLWAGQHPLDGNVHNHSDAVCCGRRYNMTAG